MNFNVLKAIQLVRAEDIKPYTTNPREHEQTVEKLTRIIPMVGFNVPLLIDKQGVIVKGHARYKAGLKLGMAEFPCVISEATDEQNRLDRISDNRVQEFSTWLGDYLKGELTMLNLDIKDLELDAFLTAQEYSFIENPVRITADDMEAGARAMHDIPQTLEYIKCTCEVCQHVWFVENNKGTFIDSGGSTGGQDAIHSG